MTCPVCNHMERVMTDTTPETISAAVFLEKTWIEQLKPQLRQAKYTLFRMFEEAVIEFVQWYQTHGEDWVPLQVPSDGHKLNSRIDMTVRAQVEDICEEKGIYLQTVYYSAIYQWCQNKGLIVPERKPLDVLSTLSDEKAKISCYLTDETIELLNIARQERDWKSYELLSHACLYFLKWHEEDRPKDWYPRAQPLKATRFMGEVSVDIADPLEALSNKYRLKSTIIVASAIHQWAADHGVFDYDDASTTGFCRVYFPESIAKKVRVVVAKRPIIDGSQIQTQLDFSAKAIERFLHFHRQRVETYNYRASFEDRNDDNLKDPMSNINVVVPRNLHRMMLTVSELDNVKLRSVYSNAILDYLNYLERSAPGITS